MHSAMFDDLQVRLNAVAFRVCMHSFALSSIGPLLKHTSFPTYRQRARKKSKVCEAETMLASGQVWCSVIHQPRV